MKKIKVFMISFFSVLMLSSCADKNSIEEADTVEETEQEIADQEEITETYNATEEAEIIEEKMAKEEVDEEPKRSVPAIEEYEYSVYSYTTHVLGFNMPKEWEMSGSGTDQKSFINGDEKLIVSGYYSFYFEDDYMGSEIFAYMDDYEIKNELIKESVVDTPYGEAELYLFKHMIKFAEDDPYRDIARKAYGEAEQIEETDEGEFVVEAAEIALIRPKGKEIDGGIVIQYVINKGLEYQGFLEEFLPQMFE